IATGQSHTCVVLDGGGVKCWGSNQFGKLGYPLEEYYEGLCSGPTPDTCPLVDVGGSVQRITAGRYHSCALLESQEVKCWGYDSSGGTLCSGVLGNPSEVPASGVVDDPSSIGACDLAASVVDLSSGRELNSAITDAGEVVYWGCYGTCVPDYQPISSIGFGEQVIQASTGYHHRCVLLEGGDVYCWGCNYLGQLGYGHTDFVAAAQVPDQVGPVELGEPAVQVAAGGYHSCAILEGGDVVCWGWGQYGRLGYGNTENVGDDELPVDVGTVDVGGEVVQMSLGKTSTCAVLSDGSLKCWGYRSYEAGEIVGDDESPADVDPINVGGPVTQVSAGGSHFCAVMASGTLRCWGKNGYQLGYGDILEDEEHIGDDEPPASLCEVPVM
ncbi:MAG: hypothetical protein R6V85_03580, partial [Polyangia bacterium]